MPLIPSESYSFPEDFVQTIADARKSGTQPFVHDPDPSPQQPASANARLNVSGESFATGEESLNGSLDDASERKGLFRFIPRSLKRKIRWHEESVLPEEVLETYDITRGMTPNGASEEDVAAAIPSPSSQPVIYSDLPAAEPLAQTQAEQVENPIEQAIIPTPLEETRVIESPSADLVQTLLARALFGAAQPQETSQPAEAPVQNGADLFHLPVPAPISNQVEDVYPLPFPAPIPDEQPAWAQELEPQVRMPAEVEGQTEQVFVTRDFIAKALRFIKYEAVAVGVLIPSAILGVLRLFNNPVAVLMLDVLTIGAAVAATLIPILFFTAAPPLPRSEE